MIDLARTLSERSDARFRGQLKPSVANAEIDSKIANEIE